MPTGSLQFTGAGRSVTNEEWEGGYVTVTWYVNSTQRSSGGCVEYDTYIYPLNVSSFSCSDTQETHIHVLVEDNYDGDTAQGDQTGTLPTGITGYNACSGQVDVPCNGSGEDMCCDANRAISGLSWNVSAGTNSTIACDKASSTSGGNGVTYQMVSNPGISANPLAATSGGNDVTIQQVLNSVIQANAPPDTGTSLCEATISTTTATSSTIGAYIGSCETSFDTTDHEHLSTYMTVNGTPTETSVSGLTGNALRVQYTGIPGDSYEWLSYMPVGDPIIADLSQTDRYIIRLRFKADSLPTGTGMSLWIEMYQDGSEYAQYGIADFYSSISGTGWHEYVYEFECYSLAWEGMKPLLVVEGIDNGNVIDITIDKLMMTRKMGHGEGRAATTTTATVTSSTISSDYGVASSSGNGVTVQKVSHSSIASDKASSAASGNGVTLSQVRHSTISCDYVSAASVGNGVTVQKTSNIVISSDISSSDALGRDANINYPTTTSAPYDLVATFDTDHIDLSWKHDTCATFEVQRSVDDGTWEGVV